LAPNGCTASWAIVNVADAGAQVKAKRLRLRRYCRLHGERRVDDIEIVGGRTLEIEGVIVRTILILRRRRDDAYAVQRKRGVAAVDAVDDRFRAGVPLRRIGIDIVVDCAFDRQVGL